MKTSELRPSKFFKATDFSGGPGQFTISHLDMEEMRDGEEKPALYFHEDHRGLIVNKTNLDALEDAFGDETDDWAGHIVELFVAKTRFAGKKVDGLRVRPAHGPAKAKAAVDELADELLGD